MFQEIVQYQPPGAKAAIERYKKRQQESAPRSTDDLSGKEVVTRSSKKPVVIRPPLEATPMELARHRSDTHTRVAHGISSVGAYATGVVDGIVDLLANGSAEIIEDGTFFVSKVIHGTKHGWERGKFPSGQNQ